MGNNFENQDFKLNFYLSAKQLYFLLGFIKLKY